MWIGVEFSNMIKVNNWEPGCPRHSRNTDAGLGIHFRHGWYQSLARMFATHSLHPSFRTDNEHIITFAQARDFCAGWCDGNSTHSRLCDVLLAKIRRQGKSSDITKCFTAEFAIFAKNEHIFYGEGRDKKVKVLPWIPFLLLFILCVHENVDHSELKANPFIHGGVVNKTTPHARASDVKQTKQTRKRKRTSEDDVKDAGEDRGDGESEGGNKDGDSKSVGKSNKKNEVSPERKRLNVWLVPDGLDAKHKGYKVVSDTQMDYSMTTKRQNPAAVPLICNPEFAAHLAFQSKSQAMNKTKLRKDTLRKLEHNLVKTVKRYGDKSDMGAIDIMKVDWNDDASEAEEGSDDESKEAPPKKPKTSKIDAAVVGESVVECAGKIVDAKTLLNNWLPSKTDGIAHELKKGIMEELNHVGETICKIGELAKLKNTDTVEDITLGACIEVLRGSDEVNKRDIEAFVKKVLLSFQQTPMVKLCESFKSKHLKELVNAFGVDYKSNMQSLIDQREILTDEDMGSKMVVVEFAKRDVKGLALSVYDIMELMEDNVRYSNLYEAQSLWTDKNWTSNIAWIADMEYDNEIWDGIRHIVWVEEGLMADLKQLLD